MNDVKSLLCLNESDSTVLSCDQSIEENVLKNSAGNPLGPRDFPDRSEEIAASISSFVMGSSNLILPLGASVGMFSWFRKWSINITLFKSSEV